MNKKQYQGLVALLIIVGALAFYWFSYRPMQFKQMCFAEAEFDRRATNELDNTKRQEFINMYYDDCLMRFGLK
jgi:hypothetical protein